MSFASESTESAFASRDGLGARPARKLAREFLAMSQADVSTRFKGSAMKRAKRRGLARNAAVVLGNVGSSDDVPALMTALRDEASLVRGHAAWALGRLGSSVAATALRERLDDEPDAEVCEEIAAVLRALKGGRDSVPK